MEWRKPHCMSAVPDPKVSEALMIPLGTAGILASLSSVGQDGEPALEEAAIPTAGRAGADIPHGSALWKNNSKEKRA